MMHHSTIQDTLYNLAQYRRQRHRSVINQAYVTSLLEYRHFVEILIKIFVQLNFKQLFIFVDIKPSRQKMFFSLTISFIGGQKKFSQQICISRILLILRQCVSCGRVYVTKRFSVCNTYILVGLSFRIRRQSLKCTLNSYILIIFS